MYVYLIKSSSYSRVTANVVDVSSKLNTLSSGWETYTADHVTWTTDTIDKIISTSASRTTPAVVSDTLGTISNVLNVDVDTLEESQVTEESSTRYVHLGSFLFPLDSLYDTDQYKIY